MFGGGARMVRHLEATGAGLPPDHAVVVDPPDARTAGALAVARRGSHVPARALLAATREEGDWALRNDAVGTLAELALADAGWLDDWLAGAPDDPDALTVEAFRRIAEAWKVRTGALAKDVAPDRMHAFHALLNDALPVVEAAVAASPGDPVPWAAALNHCIGAGAPREVFDDCLRSALDRAPHHVPTHIVALQYLAAKWHGSDEEILGHAARVAAAAPEGSSLRALEVVALVDIGPDSSKAAKGALGAVAAARVDEIITTALAWSASRPAEDREARLVRNHLVWMLNRRRRWAQSLDVYRSIGRYASREPWYYLGDPLAGFLGVRDGARAQLARSVPRGGTVPAPAVPLPDIAGSAAAREIAYVLATPQQASRELLLTGATVRLAPAGRWTLMETAPSQDTRNKKGRRATLLRLDGLAQIAGTAFDADGVVAFVARCEGDDGRSLSLVREGDTVGRQVWTGPGTVPPLETARKHADLFVGASGGDAREVVRLLRDPGDPSELLVRTLHTLGLPPLPVGFGERPEVLEGAEGAVVHRARSLWQGIKDFMSEDDEPDRPLRPGSL
ncbi:hypothetical protein [Streptomyces sp. NPDC060198]|uniref:hypothetical protein n=1 Tax=Streptomyces sp. NPDC060198 TaxID=3347070 RepID=UPI00365F0456